MHCTRTVFVRSLPPWFVPPVTIVLTERPPAEWFDRPLPRHPRLRARRWLLLPAEVHASFLSETCTMSAPEVQETNRRSKSSEGVSRCDRPAPGRLPSPPRGDRGQAPLPDFTRLGSQSRLNSFIAVRTSCSAANTASAAMDTRPGRSSSCSGGKRLST